MLVKILSGLPGSGKSHRAEKYKSDVLLTRRKVEVVSADNYYLNQYGVYQFDPRKIGAAHDQCFAKFYDFVRDLEGPQMVVVDNTNTSAWEIAPYLRLAEILAHQVEIIRIWCDPIKAHARNIHGVPIERIMEMYRRMLEPLPPHWRVLNYVAD